MPVEHPDPTERLRAALRDGLTSQPKSADTERRRRACQRQREYLAQHPEAKHWSTWRSAAAGEQREHEASR